MKIYFYGANKKAVEKKCSTFINSLMKNEKWNEKVEMKSICTFDYIAPEDSILPKGYRVRAFCAYNITKV